MKRKKIYISLLVLLVAVFLAGLRYAGHSIPSVIRPACAPLEIFPDYASGTVIPSNIAPLNFCLPDTVFRAWVEVTPLTVKGALAHSKIFEIKRDMVFPQRYWKKMMRCFDTLTGGFIHLKIIARTTSGTYAYPDIFWHVKSPITPYITYRLVQPIPAQSQTMVLYERHLESFEGKVLVSNSNLENTCFNCHTYRDGHACDMTVHLRGKNGGTLVSVAGEEKKVVLPGSVSGIMQLVYPAWNPVCDWVAYSTANNGTMGYYAYKRTVNILDTACNIVLYNVRLNSLHIDSLLWTDDYEQTWPAWSPDGEWLYFCRTPKVSRDTVLRYPDWNERVRHIFFDLARVGFDRQSGRFTGQVETVLPGRYLESYAMPAVSPDGRFVLASVSLFNSIPYHAQGDLVLVDMKAYEAEKNGTEVLDSGEEAPLLEGDGFPGYARLADELNSGEDESWHQWDYTGSWVMINSKRMDGHNLVPYFAWFDGEHFSRPFVLPQKNPRYYQTQLKAFNLPMFVKEPSGLTPKKVSEIRKDKAEEICVKR